MKPHLTETPTEVNQLTMLTLGEQDCSFPVILPQKVERTKNAWSPCLLFAYQFSGGKMHRETIARCNVAARCYHHGFVSEIFLTAKVTRHDMIHDEWNGLSLVSLMRLHLIEQKVPADCIHIVDTGVDQTNTHGEIQIFAEVLKNVDTKGHPVTPFLVSSWYHVPRIKMMWKELDLPAPGCSFASAYNVFDILLEPFKVLWYLLTRWAIPGFGRIKNLSLPTYYQREQAPA